MTVGIMPTSKEMEELLGSQTTPVHLYVGWLQDQEMARVIEEFHDE